MSSPHTTSGFSIPRMPDYDILRPIGRGAFGEIWLARATATGRLRAVKAVFRSCFHHDGPYETEFAGVRKFEEVSREHEGFIDVLHVRRDDEAGYFAYVMEAADDVTGGPVLDGQAYEPRTLEAEKVRRGRLSPAECVRVALALTESLGELHRRGLVHRDIKPANIVFVRNAPKLADIGLVTEMRPEKTPVDHRTLVGTAGYMDPLVHGSIQGDLYSFGRLVVVMATGLPVGQMPDNPATFAQGQDLVILRELLAIADRACHPDRSRRYRCAEEIQKELVVLQAGTTLRHLRRIEFWTTCAKRFGPLAAALVVFAGVGGLLWKQRQEKAAQLRQQIVGSHVAHGTHAVNEGDLLGSLSWYAEALRLDQANPRNEPIHRLRLGAALGCSPTIVQMWFTGHSVNFACFAAQENQVFLARADHRWAVHDLASGQPLYPGLGLGSDFEMAALAPAARLAFTASRTHFAQLWDFTTGRLVRRLETGSPTAQLFLGALSSDGQWAAASGQDGGKQFVALWSLTATNQPPRLLSHASMVLSVTFSPDGRRLLAALVDGRLVLWDTESAQILRTMRGQGNAMNHGAFSPDGRRIASGGFDWTARLWDAESGAELLPPLRHGDGVRSAEFSADGLRLVTAGLDFAVRVWSTTDGRLLLTLRHNSKPVYAAFSPSGRYIVTSTYDGTIRVWDLHLQWRPEAEWSQVVFSGDGARCVLFENDRLELKPVGADRALGTWTFTNSLLAKCLVNHHGSRLVIVKSSAVGPGLHAQLWDCALGQARGAPVPTDRSEGVRAVNAAGDLALLQTGGRTVVWHFEEASAWLTLPARPAVAAFDPAGQRLAWAVSNRVEVWSLSASGSRQLAGWKESAPVQSLVWSPEGRRLLVACSDDSFDPLSASLREPLTGALVGAPLNHLDGVLGAAFSPDGQTVITCSEDFTAVLWNAHTGRQIAPALRHADHVVSAAFSGDGRLVATACGDRQVRVWDALTGEPVTPPIPQRADVRGLRFVAGGRKLVVQLRGQQAVVWTLPLECRPVEDAVQVAGLLSAQQTASAETVVPHSAEALRKLWERLRAAYPADFSLRAEP